MLSFYIDEISEVRSFMKKLFKDSIFDNFQVKFLEVQTFVKFEINGLLNKDFFPQQELTNQLVEWRTLKPIINEIIKGNNKPKFIKIVFSLPKHSVEKLSQNAEAMFLNISYSNNVINFTTGVSQKIFSVDNLEQKIWNESICAFFKKHAINFYI